MGGHANRPTRIDWPARQARAAIWFDVIDERPVNPCERTGIRYGRNELGHWGEQLAANALVTTKEFILISQVVGLLGAGLVLAAESLMIRIGAAETGEGKRSMTSLILAST